ncbi:PD40 domain-containing protein [Flagellimonas sp. S3867]|uniref:PD40 domain-containing protein n=1 Tax=Flagellimonas sp. S3867 TaxID=2768063 RepID=UPI001687F941|nr:PD40 domain-containing protein [Flagellimonas sp. S3867]
MKKKITFLLFWATAICFGQIKMFEPDVISDDQSFGITMSPDGRKALFVKAYGGRDSLHLFESYYKNGAWQQPKKAFFANKTFNEIDPSYTPDGNGILFNSLISEDAGYDVFMLKKTQMGWTKPYKLPEAINTEQHEFYATMALNKNIYFTRRMDSNDIYMSQWREEGYQPAIPVSGLNTDTSDSNPYISPDEDFLIFISRREGGFGNADLYVSFRKNNKWSNPINLGVKINTEVSEFCPTLDLKNKKFLFSRTIFENELRIENIYSIPLRKLNLKKLKKQAKWELLE